MNHLNPKGQNMRRILSLSSVMALCVFLTSFSYAQEIIELDLNFRDSGNSIGDEIERLVNALPGDIDGFDPLSPIDFLLADDGDVLTEAEIIAGAEPSVTLSLVGISSNDTGATSVSAGLSGFAINSAGGLPGDASTALDSGLEEQFTISFNSDIEITEIDFGVFGDGERFQVGDTIFEEGVLSGVDVADLSAAPIFVAADTPILFAPLNTLSGGNSSIQLQDVTINVLPAVPEPSSMLALMGLAGLFAAKRRR